MEFVRAPFSASIRCCQRKGSEATQDRRNMPLRAHSPSSPHKGTACWHKTVVFGGTRSKLLESTTMGKRKGTGAPLPFTKKISFRNEKMLCLSAIGGLLDILARGVLNLHRIYQHSEIHTRKKPPMGVTCCHQLFADSDTLRTTWPNPSQSL